MEDICMIGTIFSEDIDIEFDEIGELEFEDIMSIIEEDIFFDE